MKLPIPLIQLKNDQSCGLSCTAMILKYKKIDFDIQKIISSINVDEYGYSLLDIAEKLSESGVNLEFGFWDDDLIGENYYNSKITLSLEEFKNINMAGLHQIFKDQIFQTIKLSKHSQVKIVKPTPQKISEVLNQDSPILLNLDVSIYHDKNDDSIHSVLIIGENEKNYLIMDPLLGEREVAKEIVLKSWVKAGGYYLFIK